MSPLMQLLYEYVCGHNMWSYMDPKEYAHLSTCLMRLEDRVEASLSEKDRKAFRRCLDMLMELNGMESEAMFQAAFAAARELS